MNCPQCGYEHLRPYDVKGLVRSYECWSCGHVFQTIERLYREEAHAVALDIMGHFRGQVREIMEGE
jgi:uncharacterized Zn finger protein